MIPGPGEIAPLGDKLVVTPVLSADRSTLDMTFKLPLQGSGARWAAVCFCDTVMTGPVVLCEGDPSTVPFTPQCADYDAANYGISLRAPGGDRYSHVVSSTLGTDGIATITVRINASVAAFRTGTNSRRSEFAVGNYMFSTALKHPTGSAAAADVDFVSGSAQTIAGVYDGIIIAYSITGGSLVLWSIMGGIVYGAGLEPGPKFTVVLKLIGISWILGLVVIMGYFAHDDAVKNAKTVPIYRAIGHIGIQMFGLLLFPVTKTVSLARVIGGGTSFERAIPFHVLIGVILLIVTTVHFAGMYIEFAQTPAGRDSLLTWQEHSHDPNIPDPPAHYTNQLVAGFISWLFIVLLSLPAFARQFIYKAFRISHFLLFPLAIVFAILHVPTAGYVLIPGLTFYVLDLVARAMFFSGSARIVNAVASTRHNAVRLDIEISDNFAKRVTAGQYVFLSTSYVGTPILKPFSIAHTSLKSQKLQTVSLYIKSNGVEKFTGVLANETGMGKWKGGTATLLGPYGSFMVDPWSKRSVVMISGGIGITPMLSVLQHLLTTPRSDGPELITWIWTVREEDVLLLLCEALEDILSSVGKADVDARIYLSKEPSGSRPRINGVPPAVASRLHGGRPDLNAAIYHGAGKADASDVGVFTCGPDVLTEQVATITAGYGFAFHEETFAFGGTPAGMATSMKMLCSSTPAAPMAAAGIRERHSAQEGREMSALQDPLLDDERGTPMKPSEDML